MEGERGFTLIEITIGVAIVAVLMLAAMGLSLASKPFAVNSAAVQFDAVLDAARTEARVFDSGVTVAVAPLAGDPAGQGFQARLYQSRPAIAALTAINAPGFDAHVTVAESEILGTPAFAITIHANGLVSGIPGYSAPGQSGTPETSCPAKGYYHFTFSAGPAKAERYLRCRIDLAQTGAPTILQPPASSTAPGPIANNPSCPGSSCAGTTLPPNGGGTCPGGYSMANPTTCVALVPGACAQTGGSPFSVVLNCSPPSGGTGMGYGVQQYTYGQGALVCDWTTYSCTVSGLSPSTTYTFAPLFGDSAPTHVWGAAFTASTGAALSPGSCSASPNAGDPQHALDISCTQPSGGSGQMYGVQIHGAGESPAVYCDWTPTFTCTVSGLVPGGQYTFSPLFGDSNATRVWGADFSGTTANWPPLVPGSCGASPNSGDPQHALDITCSQPSGGTGQMYGVQIHAGGQSGTVYCDWTPTFSCTVSGLSPQTAYWFSPLFGDSNATHVWGNDFSGVTTSNAPPTSVTLFTANVNAQLTVDCPYNFNTSTADPGPNDLAVYSPTSSDNQISLGGAAVFAVFQTFTVPSTNPVAFVISGSAGGTLAVGDGSGNNPNTLSGSTWRPPSAGAYTIGFLQSWDDGGYCGSATSGVTAAVVWSAAFTLTATQ